ncbi:FkbM family methyltransferase [Lacibacter sp. H407]|uniref:FkbM family methyltransferase n=1 Tax=Lacibacter sp. H407 TaxID=3133423 RepID=UPI0030BC3620
MKQILFHLIRWYSRHLPFPHKGLKYFEWLLGKLSLEKELFVKKLPNGMLIEVSANDHIEKYLFWYGSYEKKEVATMQTLLGVDSVVVDIGANIGYFSLMAAKKATAGHIYSFEPATKNLEKLKRNISLNRITNIYPIQAAINNVSGKTTFYISTDENSGMSGLRITENFSGQSETVKCITLDEAVLEYNLPKIDLIKIDVEGSEINVLQGMTKTRTDQKPIVLIEVSAVTLSLYDEKIITIYDILLAEKYRPYKVAEVNILEKIKHPQEADLVFFIPERYRLPETIKLKELCSTIP